MCETKYKWNSRLNLNQMRSIVLHKQLHEGHIFSLICAHHILWIKLCSHLSFSPQFVFGFERDFVRTSPRRRRWGAGRGRCWWWAGSQAGGRSAPPWSQAPRRWRRLSVSSWAFWEISLWQCQGRNYWWLVEEPMVGWSIVKRMLSVHLECHPEYYT